MAAQPAQNERIDRLEEALMEMAYQSRKTEMELAHLSREMLEFKGEMRVFKDEMREFKDEMLAFKEEMLAFKEESQASRRVMDRQWDEFKEEMLAFKEESQASRRVMDRQWGNLANRLGTLVEDIVAPGVPDAIMQAFGFDVTEVSVRRRRKVDGRVREYDVIAVAAGRVFLIDVKSTYRREYLAEFDSALAEFPLFFPEYQPAAAVAVVASLNLSSEIIDLATARGWLALQLSGGYLEFVNSDQITL